MGKGVIVYKDSRYRGTRKELGVGVYPTSPTGNDNISSVKVDRGFYALMYQHTGFRGACLPLFEGNYSSLPGWNDKISSIEVKEHNIDVFPLVHFYEHSNYGGFNQVLAGTGQSTKFNMPFFKNDSISSLKVPEGITVVLYKDSNYRGSSKRFAAGDYPSLGVYGWNDKASSVEIISADLELVHIQYDTPVSVPNGNPIAISSSTRNDTDIEHQDQVQLHRSENRTVTRSWTNSTMVGTTISVSSKVGVSGPISAEVSSTISTTLQNTFTVGESESVSQTVTFTKSLNVAVPPHSIAEATVMLTPQKYSVNAIYTFRVKGTDRTVTQECLIEIDDFHQAEATITIRSDSRI
mmetsp:Transcript_903/g.1097  ORF Transcript_903/g.1097 Transcript_903/m.1097 type:complete len:351 (+) Transcript_903:150-1202(+)|eukprot:CAMPEP_0184013556 /NCGR_PEP_ID=MMETSP0954-20121128/5089_1 /TAXON_ID=627963 /ORGANISM="Aplanochytrium sp, Strain PBS07" /LENGTH=350 /DNA_ID=CAMNT_0026293779 /DNA_START=158 /DNA_END=1210 /DNA_ORIENTATION=+